MWTYYIMFHDYICFPLSLIPQIMNHPYYTSYPLFVIACFPVTERVCSNLGPGIWFFLVLVLTDTAVQFTDCWGWNRISQYSCCFSQTKVKMLAVTIFSLIPLAWCSPIIDPFKDQRNKNPDYLQKGFCLLPQELGRGEAVFLEDCNTLGQINRTYLDKYSINSSIAGRFETLPKPESSGFYTYVCLTFEISNEFQSKCLNFLCFELGWLETKNIEATFGISNHFFCFVSADVSVVLK